MLATAAGRGWSETLQDDKHSESVVLDAVNGTSMAIISGCQGSQPVCPSRCIRYIVSTLPDEFLHALLLLSLFPGSFERRAAAELLGMSSSALSKTRSLLRILATCNLLQHSSRSERYIMHASVRACCRSLAQELGLTYESARYSPFLGGLFHSQGHSVCCRLEYTVERGVVRG